MPAETTGPSFLASPPGKGHWETHPGDDLVYVLDGAVTLEIIENDGPPQSFALAPE